MDRIRSQGSSSDIESSFHSSSFDAYVARNKAGEKTAGMWIFISLTFTAALLAIALATGEEVASALLAVPLVFLGSGWEQWRDARGGRESLRQDVIALSNVLYQDAAMINRMLKDEMIHEYLRNLLQAGLRDEEFGQAYWEQALRPFLEQGTMGFREDWRYRIDLAPLASPVRVPLRDGGFSIEPTEFWRLTTVANYRQHFKETQQEYFVGSSFSLRTLPAWSAEKVFFLRELTQLPPGHKQALAAAFGEEWVDLAGERGEEARAAAEALFGCEVAIAGRSLEPAAVQLGELGVRWRYSVDEELRQALTEPVHVRVATRTIQPHSQTYFPVNLTVPTRHPTVQFTYSRAALEPADVGANVFFSSEKPYRDDLVERDDEASRIDVQTGRDDWVFVGSGCMFSWGEVPAIVQA